jgi:polyisoprenoid-binding protein YceI
MRAQSGQITGSALRALLADRTLAGHWVLDPQRSSIRVKTKVMGLLSVNGVFREVSGHGTVSADGKASGTLTVVAASIDTKNTRRDAHLRSAEIFDSGNHPHVTFTADGIRPAGREGVAVTGALTVRGHTRPLSFNAVMSVPGDGEIRLATEIRLSRAEFDLSWKGDGIASMTSIVTIHAVFARR